MPARQIKSLKVKKGYGHREHRSYKGRKPRMHSEVAWKIVTRLKEEKFQKKLADNIIKKLKNKI